jgi:hypothetical protein
VAKDIRHRFTRRRRGIDSAIDGALVMERYGHPSVDAAKRRLRWPSNFTMRRLGAQLVA